MKPILKRRADNRLAKLARMPGGRTVASIETDVEARMEVLKDACLTAIQDRVQDIVRIAGQMPRPPGGEDLGRLYGLCNEVVGLAGVAHLEDAGRAAMSFCQLLDGWRSGKAPWSAAPFDVHLGALQLLSQPDSDLGQAARDHMVDGLHAVVRRALS
jgi:hypothetical protein